MVYCLGSEKEKNIKICGEKKKYIEAKPEIKKEKCATKLRKITITCENLTNPKITMVDKVRRPCIVSATCVRVDKGKARYSL